MDLEYQCSSQMLPSCWAIATAAASSLYKERKPEGFPSIQFQVLLSLTLGCY